MRRQTLLRVKPRSWRGINKEERHKRRERTRGTERRAGRKRKRDGEKGGETIQRNQGRGQGFWEIRDPTQTEAWRGWCRVTGRRK